MYVAITRIAIAISYKTNNHSLIYYTTSYVLLETLRL